MIYLVACTCGKLFEVTADQAGEQLQCECDAGLVIPSEMKLRGIDQRYSVDEARVVKSEDLEKDLQSTPAAPANCVKCHSPTESQLKLICECERRVVSSGSPTWGGAFIWSALMLTCGRIIFNFREDNPVDLHGRDTVYKTPVALCENCYSSLPAPSTVVKWFGWLFVVLGVFLSMSSYIFFVLPGMGLFLLFHQQAILRDRKRTIRQFIMKQDEYCHYFATYPDIEVHEGMHVIAGS